MNNTPCFPNLDHDGVNEGSLADAAAELQPKPLRHLVKRSQVLFLLQLTDDQLQHLINTRQLLPIRIVGEERFCSKDLSNLIDTYKFTAVRRAGEAKPSRPSGWRSMPRASVPVRSAPVHCRRIRIGQEHRYAHAARK